MINFEERLREYIREGFDKIVDEEIEKAVVDATKSINNRLRDHAAMAAIKAAKVSEVHMHQNRIIIECRLPEVTKT